MADCIDCPSPEATRWVGWEGRTEGPYPMCDMCTHHSVKNRGAVDIGPYIECNTPTLSSDGKWIMETSSRMFTFGTDVVCTHPDFPSDLSNYWVTVELPRGYDKSHREVFMSKFTEPYCGGKSRFAFEYTDRDFGPSYFPKGELIRIKETD